MKLKIIIIVILLAAGHFAYSKVLIKCDMSDEAKNIFQRNIKDLRSCMLDPNVRDYGIYGYGEDFADAWNNAVTRCHHNNRFYAGKYGGSADKNCQSIVESCTVVREVNTSKKPVFTAACTCFFSDPDIEGGKCVEQRTQQVTAPYIDSIQGIHQTDCFNTGTPRLFEICHSIDIN